MEIGEAESEWDKEAARSTRLPRHVWAKLDHIAKVQAAAGRKSKRTRQKVSTNDVLMAGAEHVIQAYEVENGKIELPARPPGVEPPVKAKLPAKKGGAK